MDKDFSIFIKRSEINQDIISTSLSKDEILEHIPKNALKSQDIKLCKINTEWRWRILKFPNKKNEVIEISFQKPNEKRMYINKLGEWVYREINQEFDIYVIDKYYVYSN